MNQNNSRNYSCKDEELPVISKFALTSFKRDAADFMDYSPRFNQEYISGFESKITSAINVIEPQSETMERKLITGRLYATMDGLIDPINRLSGYITLAPDLKMSPADFGLAQLRKGANSRDAENVISSLHLVNTNINKYKENLVAEGMNEALVNQFVDAYNSIDSDKQKQNEILSNRRSIVQNNITLLNDLWDTLSEVFSIGKILYKASDAAKLQDYTFNTLKKQVHGTSSTTGDVSTKANTKGTETVTIAK